MRIKLFFIFLFCLFSICVNAQIIRLQKNGRLKTNEVHLHKKLSILYKSDTVLVSFKGKAYDYQFPYLYLNDKNDTLIIDVRKIEEIRFANSPLGLYYAGMIITTDMTIALTAASITYNNHSIHLPELIGAMISATATILLYKGSEKKLDTKTEWSFY